MRLKTVPPAFFSCETLVYRSRNESYAAKRWGKFLTRICLGNLFRDEEGIRESKVGDEVEITIASKTQQTEQENS